MCVIFRHKIHEIRLFQIDRASGMLGYVSHSYNRKSLYQTVGNYFIGTAPIVVGTLVIYFLTRLMLPETFEAALWHISSFASAQSDGIGFGLFSSAIGAAFGIVKAILSGITSGFIWWGFMIIAVCIALHMNLSGLDIKGSLRALPFLILILVGINFALGYVFEDAYTYYLDFMNTMGSYLSGALLLSLLLSLICLATAAAVRLIFRSVKGIGR